jgi:ATP-dependent Clp protease ATP-binding subunit ClpA
VLSAFDRYTDTAKRAIYFARLEANHRNADAITPEHILAGLTWESDSTLTGIAPLKELAVTLRAQMELPHLPSTSLPYFRDRDIPLTPDGKKVLAYAVAEADRGWDYWIDWAHLLRGLLRFQNVALQVLEETGINLRSVRSASKRRSRQQPPNPSPRWGYLKLGISRNRSFLAWLAFLLAAFAAGWIWSAWSPAFH